MRTLVPLLLSVGIAGGCKAVDPAPDDLDSLLHFIWLKVGEGEDSELAEAIRNLDDVVDGATVEDAFDGSITRLDASEALLVGVDDRDPAEASGIYMVNPIACTMDDMEIILSHPDQNTLYDDVYEGYERSYDSDRDAFLAQTSHRLDWHVDYQASILGSSYDGDVEAGLRRVPSIDATESPWGRVVIARAYMPVPAVFESGNKSMDQDYQLEIYWERESGRIIHVYGMWRQADFGSGFTTENEAVQRITLNNMEDWDGQSATLCEEGIPQ